MNKVAKIYVEKPHHTVVVFGNGVIICSCHHPNDWTPSYAKTIPSLRANNCVSCGSPSGVEFKELEEFLCSVCIEEYFDWKVLHPTYLPIDFLRMKLDAELRLM